MKSTYRSAHENITQLRHIRWTLVWYDLAVFLFIAMWMIFFTSGGDLLSVNGKFYQIALVGVFCFVFRFIFNVYRQIWRYGGIQSYIRLLVSDFCAYVCYYIVQSLIPVWHLPFATSLGVSCLTLLAALSMRMVYRYAYKCCKTETPIGKIMSVLITIFAGNKVKLEEGPKVNKINVAIIGAGRVGVTLAEELLNNKNSAYIPRCFVDVSPAKVGREIFGLHVLNEKSATGDVLREFDIHEVIFALPQKSSEEKLKLYEHYKGMGCKVKVYDFPTIRQEGSGKRHLREFDIEELLFRKPIMVINGETNRFYENKTVLITGGGGSIGSELCRQCAKMNPKQIVVLDIYENGAYDIQQELRIVYGEKLNLAVEIVSVCNFAGLERVFSTYRPDVVICAAAHKHVPLMEHNCCEAVENNIFGTLNTVELAEKYGAERVMMVSTDKAVNPTNIMGATKRVCEMIVQSHSKSSNTTTYSATRFGNVLGSAGSVIPLFKKQILASGPVTLTDRRIIRYFMTIPEASQLVLQSGAMAKNGELFVLDMGQPVKILDLAENMIKLSGFEPYKDIDIIETGLRPGEKLYEELLVRSEELDRTPNELIFIERDQPITKDQLDRCIEILREALKTGDDKQVRAALHKVVPTFRQPEEVNVE